MQSVNGSNEMLRQWARVEHHRLHCAEKWPDGPYKDAALAAVHSALDRFEAASGPAECSVCASRTKPPARVLMFPSRSNVSSAVPPRAA
jgi:hypothetical protein